MSAQVQATTASLRQLHPPVLRPMATRARAIIRASPAGASQRREKVIGKAIRAATAPAAQAAGYAGRRVASLASSFRWSRMRQTRHQENPTSGNRRLTQNRAWPQGNPPGSSQNQATAAIEWATRVASQNSLAILVGSSAGDLAMLNDPSACWISDRDSVKGTAKPHEGRLYLLQSSETSRPPCRDGRSPAGWRRQPL